MKEIRNIIFDMGRVLLKFDPYVSLNTYCKNEEDLTNEYVSPLLAKKIFGLPNTLIFACIKDPLKDECVAYHKRLKRHLVKSKLIMVDSPHGFLTNILDKEKTEQSYELIKKFITN